jgi:glycosyltransferase involved in cell wall biosynthesis
MIKLSILILALEERKDTYLKRLLSILEPQKTNEVEILINMDNRQKPIGMKRNELLQQASGLYICFCDDDDRVSPDYVSKILEAINKSYPDSIGIHLIMTTDKVIVEKTYHSIRYRSWFDEPDPERPWLRRYYRNPNHLNPVKKELAIKAGFPNDYSGMVEDRYYSSRLLQYLNTEEYIEDPIYYYDSNTRK